MFSLAVKLASKPAPSSINGAIFPWTLIVPLYGLIIPLIALSSVDLPDPLVPMIPQASPRLPLEIRLLVPKIPETLIPFWII